jgi:hypothetical protein
MVERSLRFGSGPSVLRAATPPSSRPGMQARVSDISRSAQRPSRITGCNFARQPVQHAGHSTPQPAVRVSPSVPQAPPLPVSWLSLQVGVSGSLTHASEGFQPHGTILNIHDAYYRILLKCKLPHTDLRHCTPKHTSFEKGRRRDKYCSLHL